LLLNLAQRLLEQRELGGDASVQRH
jgi:hypothetical protein